MYDLDTINSFYKDSEFNNILDNFNGLCIPFDPKWNNVSVTISGGADSALLSFILCSLIQKHNSNCTVHVIYNIRCWRTRPWQEYIAEKVYNEIRKLFPNIKFERHVNFVPPEFEHGSREPYIVDEYGKVNGGDVIELRAYAEYIGYAYNIDAYYNAVTKNPDVNINGALEKRNINISKENFYLMLRHFNNQLICHPFRFVSKDWVIKQYINQNLLDLLNITRSCEGEFPDITYKTYVRGQYVPLCENCFWCKERKWGIDENLQTR